MALNLLFDRNQIFSSFYANLNVNYTVLVPFGLLFPVRVNFFILTFLLSLL